MTHHNRTLLIASLAALWLVMSATTAASPAAPPGPAALHPAMGDRPRSLMSDASSPLSPRWTPSGRGRGASFQEASRRRRDGAKRDQPSSDRVTASVDGTTTATPSLPGSPRMLQLAFMHRHGARTEPVVKDHTILDWNRCHLSDPGAVMAVNLGVTMRRWYGWFIDDEYNSTTFHSVSTDIERTIRTGYGVISGIFNRNTTLNNFSMPWLDHRPLFSDSRLSYYYSWPSAVMRQVELFEYNPDTATETLSYMNMSQMRQLGVFTNASAICNDPKSATTCALFAEDAGTCRYSNQPHMEPEYLALLNSQFLLKAQARSNYFIYGFNTTERYVDAIGPYGMRILSDILKIFKQTMQDLSSGAPNATKAAIPVHHYSAHDITLYGLFVAMGIITPTTTDIHVMVPTFTSVARFELYSNASVTFIYSHCEQGYNSSHNYTDDDAALLNCMDEQNTHYTARNCKVDDLWRFVATLNVSKLSVPECYADPRDVEATLCAPWKNTSLATVGESSLSAALLTNVGYCMTYRANCPAQACDTTLVTEPAGIPASASGFRYVLDRRTLQCKPKYKFPSDEEMPAAWVVCIFFGLSCFTSFALITVSVFHCFAKVPTVGAKPSPEEAKLLAAAPTAGLTPRQNNRDVDVDDDMRAGRQLSTNNADGRDSQAAVEV
jgi:hypothetical protein